MSAPGSRDPLVVATQDGSTWVRRAVRRDGRGLYVLEGTPQCCPEYVMATLPELAEHGLRAMADALPVPVNGTVAASTALREGLAALLGEAKPARDGVVRGVAEAVSDRRAHDHSEAADWDWYCLNLAGYIADRTGSLLRRLLDAEAERNELRARVAELEAAAGDGHTRTVDEDPIAYALTERAEDVTPQVQKLRGLLARQREDVYESPLHRTYAVPHDLPEVRP